MERLIGVGGVIAILGLALLVSANRRAVRPRVVVSAFALQAVIAVLVLYLPAGKQAIAAMSGVIQALLNYANAGIDMVFGPLADEEAIGVSFVVHVLPVVIFFSSLMSVLYYLGVMQRVVSVLGRALQWLLGTRPVESLNAAANVFVGQTEAPLVIKPYLGGLTRSQLFAVMTSGMASVSGTILAAYAQLGISIEYLLAATFMSAPGGLLMAKLIFPEGREAEPPVQDLIRIKAEDREISNVIMAAAVGASDGLKLAANIGAMLIAFVSLIALANGVIGLVGGWLGFEALTAQDILGLVFAPVMVLLNVPWSEAQTAGAVFGEKLILNEFVAYINLSAIQDSLSERTVAILTFALCGFANFSSIGILLGGLGALIPDRLNEMAGFGLRVVAAGSLSNLMSAALAGLILPL